VSLAMKIFFFTPSEPQISGLQQTYYNYNNLIVILLCQ
jgi:hypothetical protein